MKSYLGYSLRLTVSSNSSAVRGAALHGTAKAHGFVALGGGESRDLLAVDGDILDVLLSGSIILVCGRRSVQPL